MDLSQTGKSFLLTFLSTIKGFDYLMVNQWIEKELKYWYETGNRQYVEKIEDHLLKALDFTYSEEF